MIEVKIPLKPVSVNQAFRAIPRGKFCTQIKSSQYRQFESDCMKLLPQRDMIMGEVELTMEFHLKNRYTITDLDNLEKVTIDMLGKAGYFENDNKIQSKHTHKYKADDWMINIVITEI